MRAASYEPFHWSKASMKGPEIICSVCEKAGASVYNSSFCSVQCFKSAWHSHSKVHQEYTKTNTRRDSVVTVER